MGRDPGGRLSRGDRLFHREGNPAPFPVKSDHPHPHPLVKSHHVRRILHKPVRHLTDMHQAALLDPDVDKRSEPGDIGHNSVEIHPLREIIQRGYHLGIDRRFKPSPRIAARADEFIHDIGQGRNSAFLCCIGIRADLPDQGFIPDQVCRGCLESGSHLCHETVPLGMNTGVIERIGTVPDPQESGSLLKDTIPNPLHPFQILPALKRPVLLPVCNNGVGEPGVQPGYIREEGGGG